MNVPYQGGTFSGESDRAIYKTSWNGKTIWSYTLKDDGFDEIDIPNKAIGYKIERRKIKFCCNEIDEGKETPNRYKGIESEYKKIEITSESHAHYINRLKKWIK